MNGLEDFDEFAGEDPEAVYCREKLPEPARHYSDYIRGLVPPERPPSWDLESAVMFRTIRTMDFEMVRMVTRFGAVFSAWKCKKDGKIYF